MPAIGGDMIFAIGVPSEGHDAMTEVTSAARVPRTLGTLMKGMDVRVLSMKQQHVAKFGAAWGMFLLRLPQHGAHQVEVHGSCVAPALPNNTPNTCTCKCHVARGSLFVLNNSTHSTLDSKSAKGPRRRLPPLSKGSLAPTLPTPHPQLTCA